MVRDVVKNILGCRILLLLASVAFLAQSAFSADFSSWSYYRAITVAPSGLSGAVANFPVLVRLNGNTGNGGSANDSIVFATASSSSGFDIRFTQTGATDSLPFEIQRYDAVNRVAIFWVLVPSVPTSSSTFRMYWGKSGMSGTPSNPNAVFARGGAGNGFELVYHLREATNANLTDATANGYTGTKKGTGTVTQSTGVNANVDSSRSYPGSNAYDSAGSATLNISFAYLWTVSGWFYTTTTSAGDIFSKGSPTWASAKSSFYFSNGSTSTAQTGTNPGMVSYGRDFINSPTAMGTSAWHHVAWVFNYNGGTQVRQIYIDGSSVAGVTGGFNSATGTAENTTKTLWLGRGVDGQPSSAYLNAKVQEFRVDSTQRSADWIKLCFQTQQASSIVTGGAINGLSPVLASPTNNAIGQPTILTVTWNSSPGATSYHVQISTSATFAGNTVYDQSGVTDLYWGIPAALANFTTYWWRVDATNSTEGQWSNAWSFTTLATFGPPPLVSPTNNTVNQSTSPTMIWNGVSGATQYEVQLTTDGTFNSTVYDWPGLSSSALSQSVSGLLNSQNYYWRVLATDGVTPYWSSIWTFTTVVATPDVPTLAAPAAGSANVPLAGLSLTWNTANRAATYDLQVGTDVNFGSTIYQQTGLTGLSWAAPTLAFNNMNYYWRVLARNVNPVPSAWTGGWSFTTVPTIPSIPVLVSPVSSASAVQPLTLALSWKSSTPAAPTTYEVQVSQNAGFSTTVYDFPGLTGTSQVLGPLTYNSTYYWKVSASNAGGTSNWSTASTFATVEDYTQWSTHVMVAINTSGSGGGAAIASNQIKFPILVRLTNANAPGFGTNSGSDLRFSRGSDYTKGLPYQIDYLSTTHDTAAVWVNVDTVFGSNATQYLVLHYGNSGASDMQSGGMVFDTGNGFRGAWHLGEAGNTTAGGYKDATVRAVNGTGVALVGGTSDTAGVIGKAQTFNGSSQYIRFGRSTTGISGAVPRTIEGWVKGNQTGTWASAFGFAPNNSTNGNYYDIESNGTATTPFYTNHFYNTDYATTTHTTDLTWHHIVAAYDGTTDRVYVDGVQQATGTPTGVATVDSFKIAVRQSTPAYFKGVVDEVRASSTARTADWINLSYQTQRSDEVIVGVGAPAAPVLASPSNGSLSQPVTSTLSWVPDAGAASYEVQVSASSDFSAIFLDQTNISGASKQISGLSSYTTYYWRVNAANAVGTGPWSGIWSFTSGINHPETPTLVSPATGASGLQVTLTLIWNTAATAASYGVQVTTDGAWGSTAYQQSGIADTTWVTPALSSYTTYYWRVNASNSGGPSSWSLAWTFTTALAAPGVPVLSSPANGAFGQPVTLSLTWTSASGGPVASYELQAATVSDFSTTIFNQSGLTATSQQIGPLPFNTTYYWRVNASNISATSAWSAARSFSVVEDYNAWTNHKVILFNTSPSGANVSNNVTKFPVLIRLTNAIASGFGANGCNDLRFSKTDYTKVLPYQIDYLSPTNDTAAVWVLVDTVFGNSTTQNIVMHYGMASASGMSNSSTVFDTGNGFAGVWHLGSDLTDATINARAGTSSSTLTDTMGVIGHARKFSLAGGQRDSVKISGLMGSPSAVTLSCWAKVDSLGASGGIGSDMMSIGDNAAIRITATNNAGTGRDSTVGFYHNGTAWTNFYQTSGVGTNAVYKAGWKYFSVVINPAGSAPQEQIFVNGTQVGTGTTAAAFTYTAGGANTIFGRNGNNVTNYGFGGVLDEPRIDKAARSADWIKLSFQNQQLNQTLVVMAPPAAPVLSSPTNGALNQPVNISLAWGTSANALSYGFQVSSASDFTGIVASQQASLASPGVMVNGLVNGVTYYWRANANGSLGASDWSNAWSFTTVLVPPTLSVPANNGTATAAGLSLSWIGEPGVSSYAVQVSTASDFGSTIFGQAGLTATGVAVGDAVPGATYYWKVNATGAGGTTLWSAVWSFQTAALGVAVLASPGNGSVGQPLSLNLTWGSVSGAISYDAQVATSSDFGTTVSNQTGLTATFAALSGLVYGQTYFWRVNTALTGGNTWSNTWSFTTIAVIQQVIPLGNAWNMKSFNVNPLNDTTAVVFGTTTGFLYVKDISGNAYCPVLSQDQIKHVKVGQGYQVYTNVPDTFKVQGLPVDYAHTPLSLTSGWNLIGYLPQTADSVWHALTGISSSIIIMKDNGGNAYWPSLGIDDLGLILPGEGYKLLLGSDAALTYPAPLALSKLGAAAGHGPLARLPKPTHFALHANTGNNALVAKTILIGGKPVPDNSEVAAFDAQGNPVGAGTVLHGITIFAVWGDDPFTKGKDGCASGEKISFKLWTGSQEYPLATVGGEKANYAADANFVGRLMVPEGAMITKFALSKAYPNPFKGMVKIAFDVPTLNGVAVHGIQIDVFDMKGCLVHQIARGNYPAGHYEISWNVAEGRATAGSGAYILRMKAAGFDKRMKLVRIR